METKFTKQVNKVYMISDVEKWNDESVIYHGDTIRLPKGYFMFSPISGNLLVCDFVSAIRRFNKLDIYGHGWVDNNGEPMNDEKWSKYKAANA